MSRSPNELWIVSRVFPPDEGGVQTYARCIAKAYGKLGWTVRVFAKSSAGPRRLRDEHFDLIDVGSGSKAWVYLKLGWALLIAMVNGPRPVAVHAATWRSAIIPIALRIAPVTVTVHGREIGRPSGTIAGGMRKILCAAARVVAVSHWTQRRLLERLPELEGRCVVAWNGLSDLAPSPASAARGLHDKTLVLTACRLVPRKNLRLAIEAAEMCAARGLRFRYLIAGRGPETPMLQREIDERGLQDRVKLLGFVSDERLAALYAQASIFLHPQIELEGGAEMEGFGIGVADAMASGNTCVVGNAGGPAELIADGITGRVVDGRDVRAIASAIAGLLTDAEACLRMGMAAREWAQQLSWERHCREAIGLPPA